MNKIRNTLIIAVIVAAVAAFALTACANQQQTVDKSESVSNSVQSLSAEQASDIASKSGESESASADSAAAVDEQAEESNESDSETISDVEPAEYDTSYEPQYYEDYSGSDSSNGGAEYNAAYGDNGPNRDMPGWYDDHIETYYNASNHYLSSEWTLDDEGYYRDSEGRYVIGVGADDMDSMPYGTVVQTGRGEAVVYDYGTATGVHDFATNW